MHQTAAAWMQGAGKQMDAAGLHIRNAATAHHCVYVCGTMQMTTAM